MRPIVPASALVLFGALAAGAGAGAVACGEEWHSSYGDYGDDIGRPSSTGVVDASRSPSNADSGHKTAAPQVGPRDAAPADAPSAADAADGASDAAQD